MSDLPALRLWRGHTVHQRSVPFEHRFKYGLALIDVDIDRLDEASDQCGAFSVDRSNLFSLDRKDHGVRRSEDLRPWAESQFAQAGIQLDGGAIRLVTFPRHGFYKFSPISLWLGHDPSGALRGVLYEVNNTFGETHTYVARTPETERHRHQTDKAFHVSPFFDVSGQYEFSLRWTPQRLKLTVATLKGVQRTHVATIDAKARPATTPAFLALATTKPLSSLAVSLAIHWQALKLWIKGAKYHAKPIQSSLRTTIATNKMTVPKDGLPLEKTG